MSSKGCGTYDPTGLTPAFIYPTEKIGDIYTITQGCPITVSTPKTMDITSMTGWLCLPPDQAAAVRREWQADCQ